jgi:hypothetical protein
MTENRNRQVEPDDIRPPPHYREGRRQFITTDTVRQGPGGLRVLIVLGVSLAVMMVLWGVGYWLNWL